MAVIKRETDTVKSQALEESSIGIPEERLKELRQAEIEFQKGLKPYLAYIPDRRNTQRLPYQWFQ